MSVLADHKRATLGFYKQQRKTIGITGDACPTYLISQFIIGAVVKRAEIDQLEAGFLNFLDHQYRVDASPNFAVVWLHVSSCVVDHAVETALFQRIEHSLVKIFASLGREVMLIPKGDDHVQLFTPKLNGGTFIWREPSGRLILARSKGIKLMFSKPD